MQTESAPALRRGMLLTTHFPFSLESSQGGIYQRLSLLLVTLGRTCEHVTVVFLLAPSIEDDSIRLKELMHIARCWLSFRLQHFDVCIRARHLVAADQGVFSRYGKGMFSIKLQPQYLSYCHKSTIKVVDEVIGVDPDVIVAHRLETALPILLTARRPRKLIVDLDDVEHISLWRRMMVSPEWPSERLRLLHVPALAIGEYKVAALSSAVLVCSKVDQKYLNALWRNDKARCIPNAIHIPDEDKVTVDAISRRRAETESEKVVFLFVGTFAYAPNVDAAVYLANQIFPKIREKVPRAELWIVGSGGEKLSEMIVDNFGILIKGFVQNIRDIYCDADVVCCPIRSGSGTRIKILEAAANAKPIVSTRIGAEGIDLIDGDSIVIKDSARDFASACILLATDKDARLRLGSNARLTIASLYGMEVVISSLSKIIKSK